MLRSGITDQNAYARTEQSDSDANRGAGETDHESEHDSSKALVESIVGAPCLVGPPPRVNTSTLVLPGGECNSGLREGCPVSPDGLIQIPIMKRIMFAALAAASVSLLAGCGSDSDSTDAAPETTAATQSDADALAAPATTGDIYTDTCNSVTAYLKTLEESGLSEGDRAPQAVVDEFLAVAEAEPDWANQSDQDKADFERGLKAAVAGSC
jgi:hypothetical protein